MVEQIFIYNSSQSLSKIQYFDVFYNFKDLQMVAVGEKFRI